MNGQISNKNMFSFKIYIYMFIIEPNNGSSQLFF